MILTELFDTTAPFQLTKDGTGYFTINDKNYMADFYPSGPPHCVEVSFSLQAGEHPSGNPKYVSGVEGTGDEFLVFGTMIAMIKKYISMNRVHKLTFTSKSSEPSRMKLYDRMARTLAPTWKLTTKIAVGEKFYTLTNPNFHIKSPVPNDDLMDVPF